MKSQRILLILGGLGFCLVFVFIVVFSQQFGSMYKKGLESILPPPPEAPQTREKKHIRKITVIDRNGGCMEMTSDGVVRSYATCGGDLTDANRLADPKNLLKLFEYASQVDPSKYQQKGDHVITLVIETDTGTETLYIPVSGPGGTPDPIAQVIDLITRDLPQATPTPNGPSITPTPTLIGAQVVPTDTPMPTLLPWITPSPTLMPVDQGFLCSFGQANANKRPYNVSNYICATEPSPHP